jgi:hypothetical protein
MGYHPLVVSLSNHAYLREAPFDKLRANGHPSRQPTPIQLRLNPFGVKPTQSSPLRRGKNHPAITRFTTSGSARITFR